MSKLDDSLDKALPKLRSYLAAILNVKEKELDFLPCYAGYLVFVNRKNPICIWIHRLTIEGILKVGFNLITDTGSDLIFNLIWGGSILKELLKGIIPDPPKNTLIFYPGLHRIEYGTIIPEEGVSGVVVKGFSKASNLINKTGKTFLNLLPSNDKKDENEIEKEELNQAIEKKSYTYFRFQDFLYQVLAKESHKGSIPSLSGGFEFRTIFNEASMKFLATLEKSNFTIAYKGEKGIIG
jgi:hypothetical protein